MIDLRHLRTLPLISLFLFFSFAIRAQSKSANKTPEQVFNDFWGLTSMNHLLESYFLKLASGQQLNSEALSKSHEGFEMAQRGGEKEVQNREHWLKYLFVSGTYKSLLEQVKVSLPSGKPTNETHLTVNGVQTVLSDFRPAEIQRFFFTRPIADLEKIYSSDHLAIITWQCLAAHHKIKETIPVFGTTVLIFADGKIKEHWEWVDFNPSVLALGLSEQDHH